MLSTATAFGQCRQCLDSFSVDLVLDRRRIVDVESRRVRVIRNHVYHVCGGFPELGEVSLFADSGVKPGSYDLDQKKYETVDQHLRYKYLEAKSRAV